MAFESVSEIIEDVIGQKALAQHKLVYDSPMESLEPVYFFVIDLMQDEFKFQVEKLTDNFTTSPGSGHFGELGQRATIMQQQGSKILGDINNVLRSILNIVYDLKDFKIRLQYYNDLKSTDKDKREAAKLSLKQIWLDKVDIQKGNSSIKAMATSQIGFVTLLDAFLAAEDEKSADRLDLNDRVKRIVKQRISEFEIWLVESEKELRKRYELERNYLKSQVNSLKLYMRWARPYLKAAAELEMREQGRNPALIKAFSTIILELTILGKKKVDIKSAALSGDFPLELQDYKPKRDYYACVLIDFMFRGIPQRISQKGDYTFGGRTEITFRGYALNEDELKKLDEELEKSDLNDSFSLIEGATTESLENLKDEIELFLNEKESEENKEKGQDKSNPFLALFGYYNKKSEKENKQNKSNNVIIRKENWIEKNHLRRLAAAEAKKRAFTFFDIYKKAHGMPTPE